MSRFLILGAGQSAPVLIRYLLDHAAATGGSVTVADRDPDLAAARVAGHPRGTAAALDADDASRRRELVESADVVVSLLPPAFQPTLARDCLDAGRPMVNASYAAPELQALDGEARRRGVLLLAEMGLDPGIDHMSAAALFDRIRGAGGTVESFRSYGSGVPAPDSIANPFGYAITWNPRNVVLAGGKGARSLRGGRVKITPAARIFDDVWPVAVDGMGPMEAYPNRDSLPYVEAYGLGEAHTVVRATLRHPGFAAAWRLVVRLGLPNEEIAVPDLPRRTWAELVETFLPEGLGPGSTAERAARFLGVTPDDPAFAALAWLGLFADEPVGGAGTTAADALVGLLQRKLALPPGGRDLVVLLHDLVVRTPGGRQRLTSTMVERGAPGGPTAMARTVGLPAGIAARWIAAGGHADLAGVRIPTEPAIYRPVLEELEREGIRFVEKVGPLYDWS